MNIREIEEHVAAIEPRPGVEFLGDLLLAYGLSKMTVARLMSGNTDKAETPDERLLRNKVYFHFAEVDDDELYALIDVAREDERVLKYKPRFLIVKNEAHLLAGDQRTGETLDIAVGELGANTAFFLPWAGIEKTQLENVNYADVKAAEKMAKLYDEVTKHNSFGTEADVHDLNVFFSRLLFCFFAEDTGVFEKGSFTNAIGSYTRDSGEDTHSFLDALFAVLDKDFDDRAGVPDHLRRFGYVNGSLFARRCAAPRFSAKARSVILECGTLDWSQINPDIFGSMIQAVVHPSQREGLGMHYTSLENIMKVIRPLFLDELEEAFERADTINKLERLLARIAAIQIFDPACGSGNFLVISYKELRKLEHRILQRMSDLDPKGRSMFRESALKLENFYGIEIDDFAHEIATLSLWLAKHQMNVEFKELFGAEIPLIPLREAGAVVCGNAVRIDWQGVCDASEAETYVLGNPPYLGAKWQSPEQKAEFVEYFGTTKYPKNLDYISLWFFKGAEFLNTGPSIELAFVATNSLCQGDHVGLMWPRVFECDAQISFAHQSFVWSNQARGGAGVTCVVVGLCDKHATPKHALYSSESRRHVSGISPYLVEGSPHSVVHKRKRPLSHVPTMTLGSLANDGGHLIMTLQEADRLVEAAPVAKRWVRRFGGSAEALKGQWRACLWIPDDELEAALEVEPIRDRIGKVAAYRRASKGMSAQAVADTPHRFFFRSYRPANAILVPRVSSERREYVPMDFVGPETVISDLAYAVYDAELWLFAVLQSRMHMTWTRAVAGRMRTDVRYSNTLVYNTFPVPEVSEDQRAALTNGAVAVLGAREQFSDQTLAHLYDPEKMPPVLRAAHRDVDDAVDALYQSRPFDSDARRLELLFELYEAATREQSVAASA